MLFIVSDTNNKAVWNALKIHVGFMETIEEPISFMVEKKYTNIIKKDYPEKMIYTYLNSIDLMFQLIKVKDKKLFVIGMFTASSASLSKVLKSKEIYYWVQGAVPEESFLKHRSKLKFYILSIIEHIALLVTNKQIFVSKEMQNYLEKKHKKKFPNSIIVPCISEFFYDGSKKEKDSFVYIGGMSAWQRVDIMIQMFNGIVKVRPNASLYIATLDKDIALEYIDKYIDKKYQDHVKVLSITNRREITHFLSTKEYGFLIRDDIVVNHVSSPIKLAEYLSCGVNPIISSAVKSYAPIIEKGKAGISISYNDNIENRLQDFIPSTENAIKIYKDYFSKEQHINNYIQLLNVGQLS